MGAIGSRKGCLLGKVALYRTELRSHQSVVSILGCIAHFASIRFQSKRSRPKRVGYGIFSLAATSSQPQMGDGGGWVFGLCIGSSFQRIS